MEGAGAAITEVFGALWAVWKEMWEQLMEFLPLILKFVAWVLCGIIILPCVFVAGTFFEKWVKWGEKM